MKHVTMGTAGHIDHGKTTLVKALTGVDTDRLLEEKKRGITIELGFAPLILPSGVRVSIVDVPGHEKFLKTMVAGVSGIDFALFVVAADEGIMPQTKEHLDVLNVLGIEKGIVALTKIDLVEQEEIPVRIKEIQELMKGTTLEGTSVIPISSLDRNGIDDLVKAIENIADIVAKQPAYGFFRMPVDRVFTMVGYGTVVTGTIIGGKVSKGDQVEILPEGIISKVRNIQVHNESVEEGIVGDRCAINLSRIEKEDIERGSVVTQPNSMKVSYLLDVSLMIVKGVAAIYHNQRVHVHLGTKEVLGRIRLLETDLLKEKSSGYAQLRLEEPLVAQPGDRFIIRAFSPLITLGGGTVLWSQTTHRKRFELGQLEELESLSEGNPKDLLLYRLEEEAKLFKIKEIQTMGLSQEASLKVDTCKEESQRDKLPESNTLDYIELLLKEEKIGYLKEIDKYYGKIHEANWEKRVINELQSLYKKFPYRYQLSKEEIKSKVFPLWSLKDVSALLKELADNENLQLDGMLISEKLSYQQIQIGKNKKVLEVEEYFLKNFMTAASIPLISENVKVEAEEVKEILGYLQAVGKIHLLLDGTFIYHMGLEKGIQLLKEILDEKGEITVAKYRDKLASGRKTAIALLEYFDKMQVTIRYDLIRKPGPRYRDSFK